MKAGPSLFGAPDRGAVGAKSANNAPLLHKLANNAAPTSWRTHSGFEVDFLLGDEVAVEVKAKTSISARDERGLAALSDDLKLKRRIAVCQGGVQGAPGGGRPALRA